MWVLEARKDAEKVWFPIVWEDIKETSNVIDYDIHDEITINNSSVLNANNDTTTGIANVIPWVNAPKLKLSTSIYVDKLEIPTVWQILQWTWWLLYRPDDSSSTTRNMTTIDSWGTKQLEYYDSPDWVLYSWMKIPVEWTYQIDVTYPHGSSTYWWIIRWGLAQWWWSNDTIFHSYTTARSGTSESETFRQYFNKWDIMYARFLIQRSSSTPIGLTPSMQFTITKL